MSAKNSAATAMPDFVGMLAGQMTALVLSAFFALAVYVAFGLLLRRKTSPQLVHLISSSAAGPSAFASLVTSQGHGGAVWFLWLFPLGATIAAVLVLALSKRGFVGNRSGGLSGSRDSDLRTDASIKRGQEGEALVRSHLDRMGLRVLHDVYVASPRGVTQIDHVMLVGGAIVVIETKNYSGSVFGTADQREWTQVLARGKVKNRFQNPIVQNRGHLNAVRNITGGELRMCVVFVGGAVFPKGRPEGVVSIAELSGELGKIAALVPGNPGAVECWARLVSHVRTSDTAENRKVHLRTVAAAKANASALRRDFRS